MDEAQKSRGDQGNRQELEWSDGNLARMARLRDSAYKELVSKGAIPRYIAVYVLQAAPL